MTNLLRRIARHARHRLASYGYLAVQHGPAAGLRLHRERGISYADGMSAACEPPVQKAMVQHLTTGGVFYDIGANVGFFSLLAARLVGPTGCVVAFEADGSNAAQLAANARRNGLRNLQAEHIAVSDQDGVLELQTTAHPGGATLASTGITPPDKIGVVKVNATTIDQYVFSAGLAPPTFVKIDVEGAEKAVLSGMVKTLCVHKPVVLFEVDDGDPARFAQRWDELDNWLAGRGYDVARLPYSYPGTRWHVGHSLALPQSD